MAKRKSRKNPQEPRAKKKKRCPFVTAGVKAIDYKDTETLSRFITERGKILPRRITGVSSHYQKLLTTAIKQARHVALLPFVGKE
jgi:small subunit ribosomal protein S18